MERGIARERTTDQLQRPLIAVDLRISGIHSTECCALGDVGALVDSRVTMDLSILLQRPAVPLSKGII
jgi:hypothetical protein